MFGGGAKNCFKEAADFIEDHGSFGNEATKTEPQKSRQAHMRDCKFYFSFENANCTGMQTGIQTEGSLYLSPLYKRGGNGGRGTFVIRCKILICLTVKLVHHRGGILLLRFSGGGGNS